MGIHLVCVTAAVEAGGTQCRAPEESTSVTHAKGTVT